MQFRSPTFIAWQEAERQASAAENQLFARVLSVEARDLPTRAEVEQARRLRETSSMLLNQMLDEMRDLAAMLKTSRPPAASAAREHAANGDAFSPSAER